MSKCWLISVCRFRGEISQFVSPCDTHHCTTSRLPLLQAQWIRLQTIAVLCSSINHQLMHIGQLENSDRSQRPMENSFHNQIAQQEQMTAHSGRSVDLVINQGSIVGCRSLRHHFVVIGRTWVACRKIITSSAARTTRSENRTERAADDWSTVNRSHQL